MSSLHKLLEELRAGSKSEREKGTYFESLVKIYLRNEPKYQDLYSDVWLWEHGVPSGSQMVIKILV